MSEFLVFIRGRSDPIRLAAAKYFFWPDEHMPKFVGFCDERDDVVARFLIADVQAIVNAKNHLQR